MTIAGIAADTTTDKTIVPITGSIENEIKNAIFNNTPREDILHVVMVISNPCHFRRRRDLAKDFIKRMEKEPDVKLYVVELVYGKSDFEITDSNCKSHLQIKTDTPPLWHKENMINIGVENLLPSDWKCFAWIDADVEFESTTWAKDTLKLLNSSYDIVQVFSHAIDMDYQENAMCIFAGFGYQYIKKREYTTTGGINRIFHPGYGYAFTREAYNKMQGIYDLSILGSGDHNMAMSFIGKGKMSVKESATKDYLDSVLQYQERVKGLRLGYCPGIIRHQFHGSKKNRRYVERWDIIIKYNYSPSLHVTKNALGLLVPTKECPQGLLDEIMEYFKVRNEDEENLS